MNRSTASGDGLRDRFARALDTRAVASTRAVADRYTRGGGGLLAGGLAYSALFAIVPAVFLVVGATASFIGDPVLRVEIERIIVTVLPPIAGLVTVVLAEAARDAATLSLLGVVGLAWGASRFIVAFQDAMDRMLDGTHRRGVVRQNALAAVALLVLIAGLAAGVLLAGVSSLLDAAAAAGSIPLVRPTVGVLLAVTPPALTAFAIGVAYRFVPSQKMPWRAVAAPAITVTVALTALARVFVFLAPRLIGAAAVLGSLVTVFASLAWLNLSFQAILLGAAWMGDRARESSRD